MSEVNYNLCDICRTKDNVRTQERVQVIFLTEQQEGRSTTPYLSLEDIDICKGCVNEMITENRMPYGSGAQGFNKYSFSKRGAMK